ncbi:hypothetical protein MIMGU_mgv1a011550mg [Erythranthe guttata]|uniref:RRM domain-containing protein n=1 Tax=Erythranthe guttata TaxID=4155 RepID=A0A022RYZ8_ERYGU|nr:hypothetical protein MIMGU_mgv1a011550mg [Erythranthe guttata]
MAFLSRVSGLLKQTVTRHVATEMSAPNASLFQTIRSMSSSSKLFVGGLSYSTDEMSLREAFSQYGEVVEARVILDRETGRSRGFGFVTFTSTEAASSAIQAYDGQDLHGRTVRVNYATEKPRTGSFGYQSGGGGYQSGGGGYQGGGGGYQGSGGGFGEDSLQGDENFGEGRKSNYTGGRIGFADLLDKETEGPIGGSLGGVAAGNDEFGQDLVDGGSKDFDNDEPNDYANTRV